MKTRLLLISSAVVALTSCSTYKAGQTPDDVYYSPARKVVYAETQQDQGTQDEYVDMSDRYLRMKSMNRSRWSSFDEDYMYWNNPVWNNSSAYNSFYSPYSSFSPYYGMGYGYGSGLSIGFGSMYGGYYGGGMGFGYSNFWGSPFYPGYYGSPIVIVGKPVYHNPAAYGPRTYNLNTYANPNRPVTSSYSHIPITGGTYRGSDRNGNATYSAPVRVFGSSPSVNTGGSSYRGGTYRGTDGSGYQNVAPRSNSNFNNSGSGSSNRSFNSGSSGGSSGRSSSGGSSGGSAPTRSFRSGKG